MNFEITGKIVSVLPEQKFNGKNGEIVKNAFVIEWQDNSYTQKLCLEVVGQDKWEKMSKAAVVGHEVLCKFNVTSREYQGKYYTTATCFYCSTIGGTNQQSGATDPSHAIPAAQAPAPQDDSPLPF